MLYAYKPSTVFALSQLLAHERRRRMEERYRADVEWLLCRSVYGFMTQGKGQFPFKVPSEIFTDKKATKKAPAPAEHQADIRARLISRLTGE